MGRQQLMSAVREGLAAAGDPAKAPSMQAYTKSDLPYFGVVMPDVRRICQGIFADHRLRSADELDDTVEQLFAEASHREERYAAIQLAEHRLYATFQTPERIPLYQWLIVTGGWWDVVDEVAANLVGPILLEFPDDLRSTLTGWIAHENRWLRRTAIIAQLTFKHRTDLELLRDAIEENSADRDFFIRKAIGWALRQYARTDPDWVRTFVDAHEDTLSALSKREARKHLSAQ